MAITLKAKRVQEFKKIYNSEVGTLMTKYAALFGLLGVQQLSLVNRRWVEKRLIEMHAMFAGNTEQLAKLEELNLRNEAAKKRYAERIAKKAAEKTAKKGWRFGRPPKSSSPTTAPAPPVAPGQSPTTVWEEMLKQQQEKDRGT